MIILSIDTNFVPSIRAIFAYLAILGIAWIDFSSGDTTRSTLAKMVLEQTKSAAGNCRRKGF